MLIPKIVFYAAVALNLLLVFTVARIYGEIVKIRKLLQRNKKGDIGQN